MVVCLFIMKIIFCFVLANRRVAYIKQKYGENCLRGQFRMHVSLGVFPPTPQELLFSLLRGYNPRRARENRKMCAILFSSVK